MFNSVSILFLAIHKAMNVYRCKQVYSYYNIVKLKSRYMVLNFIVYLNRKTLFFLLK